MKFICPLITAQDIDRSKRFYQEILKQKIKYDYGENVVFEGDFSIHLQSHYLSLLNGQTIQSGGNNFELYFEHDNLETLQKQLMLSGVSFVHKIRTEPWQQRVLRIYDPDQNIIEVGESLHQVCIRLKNEGKSIEEINKLTSLSIDFISNELNINRNSD